MESFTFTVSNEEVRSVGFSQAPVYKVGLTMVTPLVVEEIKWDHTGETLQQCLAHSKGSVLLNIGIPAGFPFNKALVQQKWALL